MTGPRTARWRERRCRPWPAVSPMRPLCRPLGDEGYETFHRIVRRHQAVEIEPLDGRKLGLDARDIVEARGLDGVPQRAAALGLEMLIEISERRARRIGCRFVRQ